MFGGIVLRMKFDFNKFKARRRDANAVSRWLGSCYASGMNAAEIVRRTDQGVAKIDRDELEFLLGNCETLRAVDTRISGWIRVLSFDGQILIQEETPDRELLLRAVDSTEAADALVDSRLADYDRMWDGCGCKVNYYE